MAWELIEAVVALLLLFPHQIIAQSLPTQTTFDGTATSTIHSSPTTAIPTPPPCCWIVIGDFAVGYNSWYSSTAEQVVATVVTTYSREHDGATVPIDSTTIYLNKTDILGGRKQFMNNGGPITIPGVPTDLLSGSYGLGQDYAATTADTDTIASFDFIDAVVTQPTPYDVWMRIGIYTETPNVTVTPSSDWTVWPSSVCGVSSAFTYYTTSYSTWISGTRTIRSTWSSATAMYTSWRPRNQVLYYHVGGVGNREIKPLNATRGGHNQSSNQVT